MNTSCLNRLRKNKTSLGKQTTQPGGMEVQDIQEKGLNDIQVFGVFSEEGKNVDTN